MMELIFLTLIVLISKTPLMRVLPLGHCQELIQIYLAISIYIQHSDHLSYVNRLPMEVKFIQHGYDMVLCDINSL